MKTYAVGTKNAICFGWNVLVHVMKHGTKTLYSKLYKIKSVIGKKMTLSDHEDEKEWILLITVCSF